MTAPASARCNFCFTDLHAFSSLIMHGDLCPACVLIAMSTQQDWECFADVFHHSLVI